MLRYLTAGESHGEALIGIVEGMPAGVPLTAEVINEQLARRWQGYGRGGRAKIEQDRVHIYSGVRFSKTIGSPIALRLDNAAYHRDRAHWPEVMAIEGTGEGIEKITLPRPGHADLVGAQKYGFDDLRPVIDRASARETAMRVACCTIARQLLRQFGIQIGSHVLRIGRVGYKRPEDWQERAAALMAEGADALARAADQSPVRMLDPELTEQAIAHIQETKKQGDSLGGVYEVIVTGVPPGLGSYVHWDRRLDGQLAQAILSIQGQKAVEIGDGIAAASLPGSQVHDPIIRENGVFRRRSNHAGGLEGGVTTGMPLVVRGYMKPIPTLIKPLETVDIATGEAQPTRYERSDVTSVPAASVVAEATVAFVIANAFLEKFGGDSLEEIRRRYEAEVGALSPMKASGP
ncbi:chorismate synthase [Rhodothermus profundi]|uniref:Chorismate synthase n=1 Tax=Rhodothermus profundi TaxID=633813 RepID=A0A1M6QJ62_9BACT|nr:chorismate synthase [Rhodothermus profundi]SHK20236.1 chorismate synthase [Rhodothermus profundi]